MPRQILTTIILFLATICSAQSPAKIKVKKEIKDTIDYTQFSFGLSNHYTLTAVTQFNGQQIHDMAGHQLFFALCIDSTPVRNRFGSTRVKQGDTLMYMSWNSDSKDVHGTQEGHLSCLIRLNQKSNTIVVTKYIYNNKQKRHIEGTKVFKILKWTFYDLILKDVTNTEFKRTYFFKKSRPA